MTNDLITAGSQDHSNRGRGIVVVGSINMDHVVRTPLHPGPGETVMGTGHFDNPGGKGANQAVAAARLGGAVAMVGRVGADPPGAKLREVLAANEVDTTGVGTDADAATGAAFITVSDSGENSIVVSPGANGALTRDHVRAHEDLLAHASVCLVQLEVPTDAVAEAVAIAGGTVILNPAPARPLPTSLLEQVDIIVPNEGELALLADEMPRREPPSTTDLVAMARTLGVATVIVTLGARGAMVVEDGHVAHVRAPRVEVVDTTAAGDTFCGALAQALQAGASMHDAATWAVVAGACTVQHAGALAAIPTHDEVAAMHVLAATTASPGNDPLR